MGMKVIGTAEAGHRLVARGGPRFRSARLYPPGRFVPGLDRIAISPVSVERVETAAAVELQGEALFKSIGLQKIRSGTHGFERLKAKGIYVSNNSDISRAEVVWRIPNRAFRKAIKLAPNAMERIFGNAQRYLDESLEIAEKHSESWEGNGWQTAEDCPLMISTEKLVAFVFLLGRKNFYRSGAWFSILPGILRSNIQFYPGLRNNFIASGVV